jgi:cytoskeletal protein CcmA (bactofilin family)
MNNVEAKRGGGRGRSLASAAARALGLDPNDAEARESRGALRNPFARDNDDTEDVIVPNCHIGVGSSFRGTLMIEGTLLVDGDFEGDILNCARIVVGPFGHVQADVHVREAIVAGVFDGGIQAEERILLMSGARVKGDLTASAIMIDEGVRFSGRCTMLDEGQSVESSANRGSTMRST